MQMVRYLGMVLLTVLTSFYFFPFEFSFLPGINTKMAMAGFGLILLIVQLAKHREYVINRDFFIISLFAGIVSFIGLLSDVLNGTTDYNYASYVISMWVWASAAYVVVHFIRVLHGAVSVRLVCIYLIAVCVVQCLLAYMMDLYEPLKNAVDSFLSGTGFMGKSEDRLYGVGASLDVAGTRFAAILIMIACLLKNIVATPYKKYIGLYAGAFFIVAIIGNMIARTTTVGLVMALLYLAYTCLFARMGSNMSYVVRWLGGISLVLLPLLIYAYYTDMAFQQNLRFAFEGFFSLWEKGEWKTNSNEALKNMYVFPESLKTWIIGDGYFDNPYLTDSYYIGPNWSWDYNDTDVGYSRFIFYFGLLGLIAFCMFFYKVMDVCKKRFPAYGTMFLLFLLLNFLIWFKVSTDIFLVFCIFLMVREEDEREYER